MAALLKDALAPNLVQTLENNPAFIHGGPFANIAHGCNSVMATQTALKLADYVVTEAGFGADLGAEKFIDIKCRKAGLRPSAAVIVATVRAIKYHGGVEVADLGKENLAALQKGIANLERHIDNVRDVYRPAMRGRDQSSRRGHARQSSTGCVDRASHHGVKVIVAQHYAEGGKGAVERREGSGRALRAPELLQVRLRRQGHALGQDEDHRDAGSTAPRRSPPTARCARRSRSCRKRATATTRSASRRRSIRSRPIPKLRGAPHGHVVNIREVRLAAGAEFVVMICGDIMTMPGLPKVPAANTIDVDDSGKIVGLF